MKMKEFEATIGFIDRYTGTEYETVTFYARNKREAKKIALDKGNTLAKQYCPDTFFVDDVCEVA